MSALKAYQVDEFLEKKPFKPGIYLVYGTDNGLIHERCLCLCNSQNADNADLVILDMSDIDADPQKLAIEALTPSLFGTAPVIRIRNGNKTLVPVLQNLLENTLSATIVIEAANLTKRDKLRVLIEECNQGWALPCYADDNKTLSALITRVLRQENISITPEGLSLLCATLGNDREITRRELEKLVNYASESNEITAKDIELLCADNAMIALDALVDATSMGHVQNLETALNRAYAANLDSQLLLAATARHFLLLRVLRTKVDNGSSPSAAIANTQPRPHFSRKNSIERQVHLWSDRALKKAANRIFKATLQSRQQALLSQTITQRALLGICLAAAKY